MLTRCSGQSVGTGAVATILCSVPPVALTITPILMRFVPARSSFGPLGSEALNCALATAASNDSNKAKISTRTANDLWSASFRAKQQRGRHQIEGDHG